LTTHISQGQITRVAAIPRLRDHRLVGCCGTHAKSGAQTYKIRRRGHPPAAPVYLGDGAFGNPCQPNRGLNQILLADVADYLRALLIPKFFHAESL
jgi:hypothetical protein